MDVKLPDGTVIQNVPEGTTKAQLVAKLKGGGMPVPSEWMDIQPEASSRQRLISSAPMRLAKGMKDPIEGAAQLLQRALPDPVVGAVNQAADYVGGEGTFLGDVLGIKGSTPQQMTQQIQDAESEYQAARRATGQEGMDVARFAGNVVSPANAAIARVLPMPKVGDSMRMLAGKGALGSGVAAATQPVMGDDFGAEKATQVAVGTAGGALLTPLISRAGESVARYIQTRLGSGSIPRTPEGIESEIRASFARDDIDIGKIPQDVLNRLRADATEALRTGRTVDAATLLRRQDFERMGVQPTLGQVTRDPGQYSKELNLRGIQNAGEGIQNRLAEQQAQISSRLRRGAASETPFEAGQTLVSRLQGKDEQLRQGVREAYDAFKASSGIELKVPTKGLASDYASTLSDFGEENIPSAIRKKFESLGRSVTIDEAEGLIKSINRVYDPQQRAQKSALDSLRTSIENAIVEGADRKASDVGSEAAILAGGARSAAADRFRQIASSPAFKAAINDAQPDDFVKKYVINGKVNELNSLAELVGPEGRATMQGQLRAYLQSKAMGPNAAGDGAGSQAAFNRTLDSIGRNKLVTLLGQQETDDLYTLGRVMAYIQQRPAGSAVNESNTGAAVANLLGKIGGTVKGAPYIQDFVVQPMRNFRDRSAAEAALRAQLPAQPAQLNPESVNALSRLLSAVPAGSGAALGYSVR